MHNNPIRGFIFDLDGTLVTSDLNFTKNERKGRLSYR